MIKLADRTHNMRTLGHLPVDKQISTAQETLDIYAPLSHRLGIAWIRTELEDLALKYLHPEIFYQLKRNVAKRKVDREKYIDEVISIVTKKLQEEGIDADVTGRPKHFYGIYQKMESLNLHTLPKGTDHSRMKRLIQVRFGQCNVIFKTSRHRLPIVMDHAQRLVTLP